MSAPLLSQLLLPRVYTLPRRNLPAGDRCHDTLPVRWHLQIYPVSTPSLPTHRLTTSSRLITSPFVAPTLRARVSHYCSRIYPGSERDFCLPDNPFHVRKSRGDSQETFRLFFAIRLSFALRLTEQCESIPRLVYASRLLTCLSH